MSPKDPFRELIGDSPAMRKVRELALRASQVSVPVLLEGETGTGKSLLARLIHRAGARSRGPFIPVNCAGVPESLFESEFFGHEEGAFTGARRPRLGFFQLADGGTLLLDEVADLPPAQQAKLLLALDEGRVRRIGGDRTLRVDVRMISATGSSLAGRVRSGRFRADLYYRLTLLRIRVPALRERRADIGALARSIAEAAGRRHFGRPAILDEDAADELESRDWPGNVRELQHAIEAAVVLEHEPRVRACRLREAMAVVPSLGLLEGGEDGSGRRGSG